MDAGRVAALKALAARAETDKVKALLAGEADANDTYVEVNAGAGGTESQDWAGMLQRMYSRWGERHGLKVELIDYHAGEQAGIKSATLLLKGENAYGYAKTESGVHRLVRISPYDSAARRHTVFASVWVYPVVDDDIEVDVNDKRPADRHLPRVGRGRAAHQHDQFGGAHHAHADRHRRRSARTSAASTRTRREAMKSAARAAVRARTRPSARRSPPTSRRARPTSAGATRSAATSSSPISW